MGGGSLLTPLHTDCPGKLVPLLRKVIREGLNHVEECELCQARGHICQGCHSESVLFPFKVISSASVVTMQLMMSGRSGGVSRLLLVLPPVLLQAGLLLQVSQEETEEQPGRPRYYVEHGNSPQSSTKLPNILEVQTLSIIM